MGLFVILMVVLLEIVGMGFSYWFGARAFGIGTTWAADQRERRVVRCPYVGQKIGLRLGSDGLLANTRRVQISMKMAEHQYPRNDRHQHD